ncbi:DUF3306 domain-containing protein [Hoeflea sp. AS60]|uniref:DUF3306 domain-containing protein n=1 Tax=Hoeflea sp. AS60 TaxID=3135780 RepID=UPI00317429F0
MAEDKQGFLARWSKRKQAQLTNPDVDPDDEAVAVGPVEPVEIDNEQLEAERTEAEANRLAAEAVDLDAAGYGFDFSIFMKRGVPDLLRKKALQKFFNSNPVLANLDGLNDYDEDYNNPLHMVYKSSWDVGRGFLTEAEKVLQQATGRLTQDAPVTEIASEDAPEDVAHDVGQDADADPTEEAKIADAQSPGDAEPDMTIETDAVDVKPEAYETADPEPLQQKRVSIRHRLNG